MPSPPPQSILRFSWWNANDFFHFSPDKLKSDRWPKTMHSYNEKCKRVDTALSAFFKFHGEPTIFGLGEITSRAAEELRDRLFPKHKVISLDVKADEPTLQIAVFFLEKFAGFRIQEQEPIVVPDMPRGTRPMAVLDVINTEFRLRLIFCHWQARLDEKSHKHRNRSADHLSKYAYDFLSDKKGVANHLVILGDFNDEPFDSSLDALNAHRHRAKALGKQHWADNDVRRVHLYNCSWRLLGEQRPHMGQVQAIDGNAAGTYYWADKKSWHNLDQIVVSGGLLGEGVPRLDEGNVKIVYLPEFLSEGLPAKYQDEFSTGLSDHLPISAYINLEK